MICALVLISGQYINPCYVTALKDPPTRSPTRCLILLTGGESLFTEDGFTCDDAYVAINEAISKEEEND